MSAGAVKMANTIASHGTSITSHNTQLTNLHSAIANHNTRLTNQGVSISANGQSITALGTKCTKLEGDIGALKLKVTTLEQKDILQNQTNSQFRQRLDRSDASVISLGGRVVQENASNQLLANRVVTLENSDRQHHQTQILLNEAKARIAQLELQNLAKDRAIETGKREHERLEQKVSDVAASMQQMFDAFKDSVKAQQKEDSIRIEQLKEKVLEQATTIALLSADVKKAHRLSAEILPGNEPSPRAAKFQLRKEKSLKVLLLSAQGKKLSSKPDKEKS